MRFLRRSGLFRQSPGDPVLLSAALVFIFVAISVILYDLLEEIKRNKEDKGSGKKKEREALKEKIRK